MGLKYANNAKTTLSGAHNNSTTTITVVDGSVFPALSGGDYFYMTMEDTSLNNEIVKVTARSTNTLTVVRAQNGTTAKSFATADKAEGRIVAAVLDDLFDLTANIKAWLADPTSAKLRAAVTDETGTGSLVFATSPTFVTPLLGTPTSGVLTNCTGLPLGSVTGLGTGVATFLATPTSANLLAAVTNETGTGALVFGTSPTIDAPAITGGVTITKTVASGPSALANFTLLLTNPDAGASGAFLGTYHNSASPAISDTIGAYTFWGNNSAAALTRYAQMRVLTNNVTNGTESAYISFDTLQTGGAFGQRFAIGYGLYSVNATGGDKGTDSINAGSVYINNDPVMARGATETVGGAKTFSAATIFNELVTINRAGIPLQLNNSGGGSQMFTMYQGASLRGSIGADSGSIYFFNSSTSTILTLSSAGALTVPDAVTGSSIRTSANTGSIRHTGTGDLYCDISSGGAAGAMIWRTSSSFTTLMTLANSGLLTAGAGGTGVRFVISGTTSGAGYFGGTLTDGGTTWLYAMDSSGGYTLNKNGGDIIWFGRSSGAANQLTGIFTINNSASSKLTVTGGTSQDAITFSGASSSGMSLYIGSGRNINAGGDYGMTLYDLGNSRHVLWHDSLNYVTYVPSFYSATSGSGTNMFVASSGAVSRFTSSEKYKRNIEPLNDDWADSVIAAIDDTLIWYQSKCDMDNQEWSWPGVSAEKMHAVAPYFVQYATHEPVIVRKKGPDGELANVTEYRELKAPVPEGVSYERIVVPLLRKVVRMEKRFEVRIAELEAKLAKAA